MSDQNQCAETPLLELARSIPIDLRGEWETQWADDGTPTGHSMAPVGSYVHRLADEIERLTSKLDACQEELEATGKLCDSAQEMTKRAMDRLGAIRAVVDAQAEDEGLWFQAKTAPEAYLQQELRKLHEAVERQETGGTSSD